MNTIAKTLVAASLLLSLTGMSRADEAVYDNMLRSVAMVVVGESQGSGSLVDAERRLVVTNYHVVGDKTDVKVVFPQFNNGRLLTQRADYFSQLDKLSVPGKVISADPRRDLVLIELESVPEGVEPIKLVDGDTRPGQELHSIGNPGASDAMWVYSSGTVRQVYEKSYVLEGPQQVQSLVVETQAPINKGDSGGPVVNADGELVAIVSAISKSGSLVTTCIHVDELTSLLRGEIKTIDSRVRSALDSAGLEYTVDDDGLFEVKMATRDGATHSTFVISRTLRETGQTLRTVFAGSLLSEKPVAESVSKPLFARHANDSLGSWQVRQIDKKFFGIFSAKLPADAEAQELKSVLVQVAQTAFDLSQEVAGVTARRAPFRTVSTAPAAPPAPVAPRTSAAPGVPAPRADVRTVPAAPNVANAPAILGTWKAVLVDPRCGEILVVLRLAGNGSMEWLIANGPEVLVDRRGRYTFNGAVLAYNTGGNGHVANITLVDADHMVLAHPDLTIKLTRHAPARHHQVRCFPRVANDCR